MDDLELWIGRGDLDQLIRACDRLCDHHDWSGLTDLRDRALAAFDRGHQLWPAAARAEYLLALAAPADWAGPAVEQAAGQFTLGPLTEVVACRHSWSELADHLVDARVAAMVAHERVLRGEDLEDLPFIDRTVLDLPLRLAPWEPNYAVATYHADRVDTPRPPRPTLDRPSPLPPPGTPVGDPDAVAALLDLVRPWAATSNGRGEAVAVRGDASAAIGALGPRRAAIRAVPVAEAAGLMGWAAASGGAHGRRRGGAAGRFGAWWAIAALTDLLPDWPVNADELGAAAEELEWFVWGLGEPDTGWTCHLAVHDPAHGVAFALAAVDEAD